MRQYGVLGRLTCFLTWARPNMDYQILVISHWICSIFELHHISTFEKYDWIFYCCCKDFYTVNNIGFGVWYIFTHPIEMITGFWNDNIVCTRQRRYMCISNPCFYYEIPLPFKSTTEVNIAYIRVKKTQLNWCAWC